MTADPTAPRRSDGSRRAVTVSIKILAREVRAWRAEEGQGELPRALPATRGECGDERPCPYVSCRWNLYLDVDTKNGSVKFNFPGLEPWELPETCALDVAARGGVTLEEVGAMVNLTRERVRQYEEGTQGRLNKKLRQLGWTDDAVRAVIGAGYGDDDAPGGWW